VIGGIEALRAEAHVNNVDPEVPVVWTVLHAGTDLAEGARRVGQGLIASAGSALLIFLVIFYVMPAIPGFISTSHPPVYTHVTRLVDPVREFGLFVLLVVVLGVDLLRTRIRNRRAAARARRPGPAGPNEMVVERAG
jgi:hypothetical protein